MSAFVGRADELAVLAEVAKAAWDVMTRYADLTLSFTDCVGAVTAREGSAAAVFGLDADFRALGFALEP